MPRSRLVVRVALLVAIVLAALALRSTPAARGQANLPLVAFTCVIGTPGVGDADTDVLGGIMVMRADGSGLRQITRFSRVTYDFEQHGANFPDDHPSFSPDGKRIVFTSNRLDRQNWDLFVMKVNGAGIQRLTTTAGLDTEAVFSPDGTKIAYASEAAGQLDIWVMNADGSNKTRLTTAQAEDIEPAWSPDGTKIAFSRVVGPGEKDIFIMNANGTNQTRLTTLPGEDHDSTWSPDGTELVITSERAGTAPFGDVFRISVEDGTVSANLTGGLMFGGGDPAWAFDGSRVAFFRSPTGLTRSPLQLWVMDASGANRRQLQTGCAINIHPNFGRAADSDGDGRPDYQELANTVLTQGDFPGANEDADRMGTAVALADHDHDGFLDLFMGVPGENILFDSNAGRVLIARGGPEPLRTRSQIGQLPLGINAGEIGGERKDDARFGQTMVACDFNGDGFQDIAIGAPGRDEVYVSRQQGSWQRLAPAGASSFGHTLAAADFNGDGRCDLAVGSPFETRTGGGQARGFAGAVRIFNGTANGVSTAPTTLDQSVFNLPADIGGVEAEDYFGFALGAGDLNGDGFADLAIGVPKESIAGVANAGIIHIVPGTATGLLSAQAVFRDTRNLGAGFGGLQAGSRLGDVLLIGNFGARQLVVGLEIADVDGVTDAGLVAVFDGAGQGLVTGTAELFPITSVGGTSAAGMRFGQSMTAGDFSGDGVTDLAVSAPNQTVNGVAGAGAVYLLFGSRTAVKPFRGGGGGLTSAGAQRVTALEVGSVPRTGAHFGASLTFTSANTLAAGDMDKDGQADLIIGAPDSTLAGDTGTGLVAVRYGVKVGNATLEPAEQRVAAGGYTELRLTWTHPDRWRALETLHLRLVDTSGVVVAWARFDEETGEFALYNADREAFSAGGLPGSGELREGPGVLLYLEGCAVTASGPDDPTVTLTFALATAAPAGERLRVEVLATDHNGGSQGWEELGTVTVE